MTPEQLQRQLDALIAGWEGECVEFKDANDNYSTSDIGKYFSALANEANLRARDAGRFIDENYSRALLTHGDFSLGDIFALDKVQKGIAPDEATLKTLRKRGLVEGRKPAVHVSASVAKASGREADYILARRQDDAHYRRLILDYLQQFQEANREKLRTMLANKWPAVFTEAQKENKLHNLLAVMKREGIIERIGGRSNARWRMAALIEPAANRKKSKGFIQ